MLSSFVPAATMAACILVLLQQAVTADDGGDSGSYFVVYEGDAPTKCVVEAGVAVDDDCCTNVGPLFGLVRDTYPSTCYILSGLLGEDGGSLEAYLGCDDGIPKYGEACYEESADTGGIIPPGTEVSDTNATSIEECGCTFQIEGNGCHKIRDFFRSTRFRKRHTSGILVDE